ncbi:MAG TPA: ABC transporter transmembrane domain-containing protein, partial [Anaerolineales bacterium]|nr:ABC transporter transmembrane domain-containing protein [Anaerolineales bacterium]HNF36936.1 ABC transporter transmembrane domain-containing protein [Anaerolineales bacterium]
MGFFAGLNDEKYDRQYSDRELTRRIAGFFKTKARQLITASVLVITLAFIGAALPVVVSRMVDLLREQPTIQEIALVGVTLMGVGVGLWGLNWMRRSLIVRAVGDVVLDLRTRAFRAAAEHDLSFYDQFSSGRIVSRITSDTNDFGQLIVIITDVVSQLMQA